MPRLERMRGGGVLWRIAVVVAWFGALTGLVALDSEATWYTALGPPLTVLVGAIVNRGWVLLVPAAVSVVWIAIVLAQPPCTDCSDGETPWQLAVYIITLLFTLPATAALGIGLAIRFFARKRVA